MTRTLSGGVRLGVLTAAGVSSGLLVHTILVCLGLGAFLQGSAWLFSVLKLLGALYLLFLGFMLIRSANSHSIIESKNTPISYKNAFIQGALSNITNPKIALFYLAFLPQFIPVSSTHSILSLFILGIAFSLLTFLVKGPVALLANLLSTAIQRNPKILTRINQTSGLVLITLGIKLAIDTPSR